MAEIITKDCKEYHIWDKVNGVWNRLFFKTNAKSVEADDGKELQTKVGALNGITSDLSCEDESIAISAKAVNDSLNGVKFGIDADGNYGYYKAGADTVTPFKSGGEISIISTSSASQRYGHVDIGDYLNVSINIPPHALITAITYGDDIGAGLNTSRGFYYNFETGLVTGTLYVFREHSGAHVDVSYAILGIK